MSTPGSWCTPGPDASESAPYDGNLLYEAAGNSLCTTGWQPILLTGFMRDRLINHFASPLNIETPDLRHIVWQPGERTGILIESVHRWRQGLVEKRPAVIVKRNAYHSVRLAISDFSGKDKFGGKDYVVLWVGSHTLFCINRTGASVEILATEVQRYFTQFAQVFKEYLNFKSFSVVEVGAISEVEEATESQVVPVTVGWAYEETWNLRKEARPAWRVSLARLCEC